ncbi:LacI family transcriptional regulator [Shinella yambaruensis]|uniref:LacI family transcriptional regulator n=1 Tax=Shinella yambaruensis TaxID=415996 RepID=A0ABQ5ZI40_9HYPH|nr:MULTISPECIES: LacI family DNA-binding transcriptional regulator [Shinella]MCJ8026668.1 LacI family transcriptional regulator [Shinella yambaruensis]MCO5136745.1 LacI family transcriptional regulator [Shinella sp.]MCU7983664.1 LacI family transcriptional regulator [Shinella yambaruensis]MCW5711873.1 LacI family DNA-binding transcriptional regulator [Shinella sp.]MDC7253579.1 LacI family transcriptional regulator [Shinella sp. YE25]
MKKNQQGQGRATLRDVADAAGVSIMTVSNVVNGKTARVSDEIRLLVKEKIKDLKYVPHLRGRGLRLAKDFAIGLVMLHPERRFLNDPFNTEVAAGMSNKLAQNGYGLLIFGAQNSKDLENKLPRISQLDALAVYIFGDTAQRDAVYTKLAALGLPMLLIGDEANDSLADASFVRQTNEEGAFQLAELGLSNGARKILFMRPDHFWPAMAQRELGARKAAAGRADVETMICTEINFQAVVSQVKTRLSANPPDFVMGGNDLFGIAATQAALQLGFSIKKDLMITGFNGFAFREYSMPLLTSMRSPAYEIGEAAAAALLKRITKGSFPGGKVLNVEFLPGDTCA